jgi:hypothetical protein
MEALLSLTADHYYKSGLVHDGIFKSNQTWAELTKKGIKKNVGGGGQIQVNLMYGQNETVDSYSRYGLLDTAPQDGIEPAFYPWAQYAGTVAIDGLSKSQNSSKEKIQDLMKEKTQQLIMSFSERMNYDIWDRAGLTLAATSLTGNSNKNIHSIPLYCQKDPTASVGVGGIAQNSNAWWRNKVLDSAEATATYATLLQDMATVYTDVTKGTGGTPTHIISGPVTYNSYERAMDTKIRYTMADTASYGFESIKYKGAKMFWDEHVPDMETPRNSDTASFTETNLGTMFFLNDKFLELVTLDGKDFAPLGFVRPPNQDASVGSWIFYGQLVCSNRRKQGLLFEIIQPVA